MSSVKMNISELSGKALDYAVAICEDYTIEKSATVLWLTKQDGENIPFSRYNPSKDWAIAGPIIVREEITIDFRDNDIEVRKWVDHLFEFVSFRGSKKQTLSLAMRCYVTSKMGETIEIPQELL